MLARNRLATDIPQWPYFRPGFFRKSLFSKKHGTMNPVAQKMHSTQKSLSDGFDSSKLRLPFFPLSPYTIETGSRLRMASPLAREILSPKETHAPFPINEQFVGRNVTGSRSRSHTATRSRDQARYLPPRCHS